jgi:Tfp pilus assembly protein PilF
MELAPAFRTMTTPREKPPELALEPMDPPPAKSEAPSPTTITITGAPTRPAGPRPAERVVIEKDAAPPADRFTAQATRELQDGNLDQRLWARVLLVSGDDQSQARTAYIRARATVLRLATRDQRVPVGTTPGVVSASGESAPAGGTLPTAHANRPRMIRIAIAATVLVVVGALGWMTLGRDDPPAVTRTAVPVAPVATASVPTPAEDIAAQERMAAAAVAAELEARVRSLRDARNWNVMVLNAAEWTRKQPDNATAWSLLATGYANLGQLPEARDAADAAVKRAPDDPRLWRDLGALDAALNEPARALTSYTKATTLNADDYDSFIQAGTLEMQLARLADARASFDKALALRADDDAALCGLASVARQQGRAADADALQKRVKSVGRSCANGMTVGVRTAIAERTDAPKTTPR